MVDFRDISLAFDDIIDTPAKRRRQVDEASQQIRSRYDQSGHPFALLAGGIAGSIPGITENIRISGRDMGIRGFQTQGENLADQLRGINTNNTAGQDRQAELVMGADPATGALLQQYYIQQRAEEEERQLRMNSERSQAAYNTARANELSGNVTSLNSMRSAVKNLVDANPQSQYKTLVNSENFKSLGEEQVAQMFSRETDDRGFQDYVYFNEAGEQNKIFQDKDGNYYNPQMEMLPMDEVPENIMRASIVASNTDEGLGGDKVAVRQFLQSTIDIQQQFNTTNQLMEMLEDNPNILTTTGSLATWANSQRAEFNAIQNALSGYAQNNDDLTFQGEEIEGALDKWLGTGRASAEARPLILALAFNAAASQQSAQSISDADVVRYLELNGAGQKDADTMAAIIRRNAENAWIAYTTKYEALHEGASPEDDYGLTNILMPKELRIQQRLDEQMTQRLQ